MVFHSCSYLLFAKRPAKGVGLCYLLSNRSQSYLTISQYGPTAYEVDALPLDYRKVKTNDKEIGEKKCYLRKFFVIRQLSDKKN